MRGPATLQQGSTVVTFLVLYVYLKIITRCIVSEELLIPFDQRCQVQMMDVGHYTRGQLFLAIKAMLGGQNFCTCLTLRSSSGCLGTSFGFVFTFTPEHRAILCVGQVSRKRATGQNPENSY